ncbi:MAG: polymer-forming cytoskeletal protein [Planctomycetota bacterium]
MPEPTRNKTILGPDCKISGELNLDNDAVIMGTFQGTLRVSGTLELTDSARVEGTLIVGTLRLAGNAKADVIAEEGADLLPGAHLEGQLYTGRLNVVEGATFQGDVCIGPKAIAVASEAFADAIEAVTPTTTTMPEATETDAMVETYTDMAEAEAMPQPQTVQTNPNSVNAVLQRRRQKVLAARQAISNGSA